ncbi:MAG TPA: ABC transporter substrate-binding protein, partial [Pirellulales bacterium]
RLKDRAAPLATTWNDKLRAKAVALVAEAKQHVQSNHHDLARREVRLALAAWPETVEAGALAAEIQLKHPEIVVGVSALAPGNLPTTSAGAFQAWETRRVSRLLARSIVEVERIGPQGPVYTSPLAKITRGDNGRRVFLDVNPEIRWSSPGGNSSERPLSAAEFAAAIIERGDRASPLYRPEWRDLVANLVVDEPRKLRIELKHRAAHFEHLLNVPIAGDDAWTVARPSSVSLGPYRIESTDDKETRFEAVDGYFAAAPKQPKQIVERLYPDVASALAALRRGEITVVDRIGPWEAAALSGSEKLVVEPCGPPSLHLLVPNFRRPAMQSALLRRALAHAIDRSSILVDQLSRGRLPAGCELADRIFLNPAEYGAASGSLSLEVRYDGSAAKLLASLAQSESVAAAGTDGDRSAPPAGGLSLAYPPDQTARFASRAIEQQVRAAGIPISLKELTPHELAAGTVDADLIYVAWTPIEPLADLPGLVGSHGIGGDSGPLVERLIRDALAAEPDQATQRQGRLAQAIRDEMLVIPLWRLTNVVAYDRSLSGVGNQPVSLYQNVEHWQFSAPKGSER